MALPQLLLSYFFTMLVFAGMDLLWLGLIAKNFYAKHLGGFLSDTVNWPAAVTFYLLFLVGIFVFSVLPAVEKNSILHAVLLGALFGFIAYATYDLTNMATVKDWPLIVTVVDMIWGAVIAGTVSAAGFYIVKFLN